MKTQASLDRIDQPLITASRRHRSLISLTPLIDVVFILLVFFMLVSSFENWQAIEFDVPGNAARDTASIELQGAMLVEIHSDGIRLSGLSATLASLSDELALQVSKHSGLRVLIQPEPSVSLQDTVNVIDAVKLAGVANIALIRDANP